MKQKLTPRLRIKEVKEDFKGYSKISNKAIKEALKTRFDLDLSLNQIAYYRKNLQIKDKNNGQENLNKDKLNRLNDFFNKLTYLEVKHIYNLVKKVYKYHNLDIKNFDFRTLDNSLSYREVKTETIKKLKKRGLITDKLKIDLELPKDL